MPKIPIWHSVKPGAELVYHDESECYYGKDTETYYVRKGPGHERRKCHACARLENQRTAMLRAKAGRR